MQQNEIRGPKAPKDPVMKRPYFFIMQGKGIYGAPRCGTLVVREVVIDEDPNPETFWWLNNEEYYENDEWDDDWYKYEA